MTKEEFIELSIGKPWVNRADGPDSYDCWGLVIDSFRKIEGVELPQVVGYKISESDTNSAGSNGMRMPSFVESAGEEGDIVCCFNKRGAFAHVGRIVCGGVLHAFGSSSRQGSVKWDRISVLERAFTLEYRKYVHSCKAA